MIRGTGRLAVELWLSQRLREHGVPSVTAGLTDETERRERVRRGILDHGLRAVIVGRNSQTRKPETYEQLFARVYGIGLDERRDAV